MAYFQKRNEEENNQNNNQNGGSFQTSSSEVGTNTSLMNDNSNRQNNISNQSGNWVNLNDYIKANEGKSGRYASNLVSDDLNKGDQHKTDVENQKTNFGNAVRQDTAYTYGSDKSSKTANSYYNDSSSVSDEDLTTYAKASKGYQGQGEFNTYDGYDSLKDTSDYFSELTGGILDPTYRANNKMNANLNQGGKILNNLTLNSNTAQNTLKDATNQFSLISGVLAGAEEEANKDRAGVVDIANANAKALKENQTKAETEAMAKLKASKDAADKSRQAKQNKASQVNTYTPSQVTLTVSGNAASPDVRTIDLGSFTGKDTSTFFNDGGSQIQDTYTQEENELKQRGSDLLSGNRTSNSKLDLVRDNSSYDSINATLQQWNEEGRAGELPNIIDKVFKEEAAWNEGKGDQDNVRSYVADKITEIVTKDNDVRNAMQSYVWGNIDKNTLISIIKNKIPKYDARTGSDYIAKTVNEVGRIGKQIGKVFGW